MITFRERVALVTGAGRGLGAAHARLLAELGATVLVHDAGVELDGTGGDPAVADAVVEVIRRSGGVAESSHEDLTDPHAAGRLVALAVERFGRLDALVHNAGLLVWSAIEDTSDDVWARTRAVGADAAFALARAAFPVMKAQGYGRIVLTASGRAMYVDDSMPGLTAYSAVKGTQLGLMVALAAEGEPHGIRVNAISPVAATRMLHRHAEPDELLPELVSPGVAFLASSVCTFSGVVLRASDGRFSCARWDFSPGVDLGRRPVSPDVIAERWPEILGDRPAGARPQAGPIAGSG